MYSSQVSLENQVLVNQNDINKHYCFINFSWKFGNMTKRHKFEYIHTQINSWFKAVVQLLLWWWRMTHTIQLLKKVRVDSQHVKLEKRGVELVEEDVLWMVEEVLRTGWEDTSQKLGEKLQTRDSIFLPEGMCSLTLFSDPSTAGVMVRGT